MTEDVNTNRKAKYSVFSDLFSDKRYLLELYRALHPEDVTATQGQALRLALFSALFSFEATSARVTSS